MGALAAALFAAILVLTGLSPERWIDVDGPKADSLTWRFSVAAADTSVALLVAALVVGPLRVLRGGRPAVHLPWRRALGIWAGGFALAHVAAAVWVHTHFPRFWLNWLSVSPFKLWFDRRFLANWLGLVQVALVLLLLWLSRDAALRRLGPVRWKWLQRSAYVYAALVMVHALIYQDVEQRIAGHRLPVVAAFAVLVVAQLAGVVVVLRRRRAAPT